MHALAVRHVTFEGPGLLEAILERHGFAIDLREASEVDSTALLSADLLILLGGPLSANDDARFPYLADEIAAVRQRIDGARPTLGICLGAQLIARALGQQVGAAKRKEIEWSALNITDAGQSSPLHHLTSPVLHWHGETFTLPDEVPSLASTPDCAHQAFALAHHTLGLQFHIEVQAEHLERWYAGHIHELDANGVCVETLRAQAHKWGPACEAQCRQMMGAWLSSAFGG